MAQDSADRSARAGGNLMVCPPGNTCGTLDERFYQAALDGLKSFWRTEFTGTFLKDHGLPVRRNLEEMWADIETWMDHYACRAVELLEYVDDLRMWGRQRVFLYEVDATYAEKKLSQASFVREQVGDVYDCPTYCWQAQKPLLVQVRYEEQVKDKKDPRTGAPLLVFKLVEMREFDLIIDGEKESFEGRYTDFFIVNLRDHFAELRLQELPVGARRDLSEERDLCREEIGKHLDLSKFKPMQMEPVMSALLRRPIYRIVSSRLKTASRGISAETPTLLVILNRLFLHPRPVEVSAYWDCKQNDVLGDRPLHFGLNGSSNHVAFGGIADPAKVDDVLETIVDISRGHEPPIPPSTTSSAIISPPGPVWRRGLVNGPLAKLEDQPRAQAVLLSAGAIAAAIIWVVIEGVGNYLLEELTARLLHGVPLWVITILVEIAWLGLYYGWSRIWRSFCSLVHMKWSEAWRTLREARKERKV